MQNSTKLLLIVACFHFQNGFCCPSSHSKTTSQPTKSTKSTTIASLSETSTSTSVTSVTTMKMKMFISLNRYESLKFEENGTKIARKIPDGELLRKQQHEYFWEIELVFRFCNLLIIHFFYMSSTDTRIHLRCQVEVKDPVGVSLSWFRNDVALLAASNSTSYSTGFN